MKQRRKSQTRKLTTAVEGHAAGTGKVVLFQTALVYELLGGYIASGKENGGSDALSEEGARGEAAVVPGGGSSVSKRSYQGRGRGEGFERPTYHRRSETTMVNVRICE